MRTEKKFRWVLFLIIGTESLKGWPRRFVEVENGKKLLRVNDDVVMDYVVTCNKYNVS